MAPLLAAAAEVQQFIDDHSWEFCFIGGLAFAAWADPRATQDVDLTLLTGFGSEELYFNILSERFKLRTPDAKDMRQGLARCSGAYS